MKKILIERDHQLTSDECRVLVEELADKLVERFGGSSSHVLNETRYKHSSGANGRLSYDDNLLMVEVSVPFMMRPLTYMIEEEIHRQCDKHFLGKK